MRALKVILVGLLSLAVLNGNNIRGSPARGYIRMPLSGQVFQTRKNFQ